MNEEDEQCQTNFTTVPFLNKWSRPVLEFTKLLGYKKKNEGAGRRNLLMYMKIR